MLGLSPGIKIPILSKSAHSISVLSIIDNFVLFAWSLKVILLCNCCGCTIVHLNTYQP